MNYCDFEEHILHIIAGSDSVSADMDISVKLELIEKGRQSYITCQTYFVDEGKNLQRFLLKQPCVFKEPVTDAYVQVSIPRDLKELYEFLLFCKKQNEGVLTEGELFAFFETLTFEEDDE